ncbi:MAG: FIST N-terminal domain-containing protein [Candidatus Nanohaloarchaea archaeon]|nr:FIST N-terminal domain-containing protein [Candidatus Nanohaloarchaea archaeon]
MTTVGEGFVHSEQYRSRKAARELVEDAFSDMEEADFGFLFCSPSFRLDTFIDELDRQLHGRCDDWVGCTTAGEISYRGSTEGGAVLLLVSSDNISFTSAAAFNVFESPEEAGSTAADELVEQGFPSEQQDNLVATFIAGLSQQHEGKEFEILQGITSSIGTGIPVVGGSAGDDLALDGTHQFYNGMIYSDAVVLVGISTDLTIHTGQAHGLEKTIASGVINETDGREIISISGQPAAEFYADAIGQDVEDLKKLYDMPLGETISKSLHYLFLKLTGKQPIKIQRVFQYSLEKPFAEQVSSGEYRIITPISITDRNGIIISTSLEENTPVHVIEGEKQGIIDAGKEAFSHIDLKQQETLFSIVVDCTCRNQLLDRSEREREVAAIRNTLQCPVAGFYGYGEIGGAEDTFCTFKNQTVSGFVVTQEREEPE